MRRALSLALFFLGWNVAGWSAERGATSIVFLLLDDWRWDALGCAGNPIVQTPHLDRLARRGVRFRNAFVTTAICSVSRASIFSGQWERRHGIIDFVTPFTSERWKETYPALLRANGYRTGFIGKFGVGDARDIEAKAMEFDFWRGLPGQAGQFFIRPDDPKRVHATARFGDAALTFLERCKPSEPFCLSVSFNAVHARDRKPREFEPDPRDEKLYVDVTIPLPPLATEAAFDRLPPFVKTSEARTRWQWRFDTPERAQQILRDYYRLVTGVDREVGRIIAALEERGLAANTSVIVTGDNGFALGDRGLADKWFIYEESIRVPLLIFDPSTPPEQRGREIDAMVLNVDLAPTVLELAGVPVPSTMQGRSLVPLVCGKQAAGWRTEFFYEHHYLPKRIPPSEGIRTERWKYCRWLEPNPLTEELYDLHNDPLEQRNLIHDTAHVETVSALREKWSDYLEKLK